MAAAVTAADRRSTAESRYLNILTDGGGPPVRHLLDIETLAAKDLEKILTLTSPMIEVGARAIPKVPALRGRTLLCLFDVPTFDLPITFQIAATRLQADIIAPHFSALTNAREPLAATESRLMAYEADALVVRNSMPGTARFFAAKQALPVINAGDGSHESPIEAIADVMRIIDLIGEPLDGKRVTLANVSMHSGRAKSILFALRTLGAEVLVHSPSAASHGHLGSEVASSANWREAIEFGEILHIMPSSEGCVGVDPTGALARDREVQLELAGYVRTMPKMGSPRTVLADGLPLPLVGTLESAGFVVAGARSLVVAVAMAVLFHLLIGKE